MDKSAELKFSSLEIREAGGLVADRTLDAEALASMAAEVPFAGPVEVKLEFFVGDKDILLQGTAKGAVKDQCGRCLVPVTPGFEAALDAVFPGETEAIDATEEVREAMLLVLQERPLCRPDCKGLCPRCGQNLNEKDCGHRPEIPNDFAKIRILKEKKQEKKR